MNFLQTFVSDTGAGENVGSRYVKEETPADENVELSLGLSLNGRFGVEPRGPVANNYDNKDSLIRASSVADFLSFPAVAGDTMPFPVYEPLTRTCSLPAAPEEEWKKRKELQSERRTAAKRKRVEKLKNVRVVKAPATEVLMNGKELSTAPALLPPRPRPSPPFPSPASVGSPGSGGSSGVSDLESQPFSGINKDTELKSTANQQLVSYRVISSGPHITNKDNVASKHALDKFSTTSSPIMTKDGSTDETLKTMLADMPCVSTKGDGDNGKKVEGFLYRYKKGEEVRIVCVCHGNFLTPAEFVKHGGGGDVEHPLRHIVVNPPSL